MKASLLSHLPLWSLTCRRFQIASNYPRKVLILKVTVSPRKILTTFFACFQHLQPFNWENSGAWNEKRWSCLVYTCKESKKKTLYGKESTDLQEVEKVCSFAFRMFFGRFGWQFAVLKWVFAVRYASSKSVSGSGGGGGWRTLYVLR